MSADVIVIGGGVVGCSVAYYLAINGLSVIILERESIGSGASAHATGFLSLLGNEFSAGSSFELGLAGYHEFTDLVPTLEEETGIDLLCQYRPSLRLALDKEEETLIKDLSIWQSRSVAMRWITGDEVRMIEPRLTDSIIGAVYENQSAQIDSYRLTLALAKAAEQRGVQIQLREAAGLLTSNGRVIGVRTRLENLFCDTVVVAAGVWSNMFEASVKFPIPVRPLKGERLVLRYSGAPLPVLISSPKRGHIISRMDGLLSVGSTGGRDYDDAELFLGDEFDRRPTEGAKIELLTRATDVLPDLGVAELIQQLAGSRPLTPDRIPIIGPVPGWKGLMLATGHTTKGIHLGPITGRIISDYIVKDYTDVPVDTGPFLPNRFVGECGSDFHVSGQMVDE